MKTVNSSLNLDFTQGTPINVTVSNGKLNLTVVGAYSDGGGGNIYSSSGTWESNIIDLGNNFLQYTNITKSINLPSGANVVIYTSTSTDMVNFSPYAPLNSDGTIASPAGRYIKVKVELDSASSTVNRVDNLSADKSLFTLDNQTAIDTSLHLVTTVTDSNVQQDTSYVGTGGLYRKTIDLTKYTTIDSVVVS